MCGRFAMPVPISKIAAAFEVDDNDCQAQPGCNIAPGRIIAVIIRDTGRKLVGFKWGLVPSWAKDPAMGYKMINARAETIHKKPGFRKPFQKHRCLIIAAGFFEWQKTGKGKKPYYIKTKTNDLFCFAGLYDIWHAPDNTRLATCTIITTSAAPSLQTIHDRMPVIVKPEDQPLWLDAGAKQTRLLPLLKPYPDNDLEFYQVSNQVNSPKNDSPECIERV
jgi:putative SOS response-associated peptidase YedK